MTNAQIIIVEDDPLLVEAIRRTLQLGGYQVVAIASSGEEAIEAAAQNSPHLILMDIRLAGDMDGIEAARHIQDRFSIPVVFLTGHTDHETVERAKQVGAWAFITKPFEPEELHAAIEVALQKHRSQEEKTQALVETKIQSEEVLQDFFDNAAELIQQVSPDGRILYVNRAWRKSLGYSEEDIPHLSLLDDIIHPDSQQHCMDLFRRVMSGEQIDHMEAEFLTKEGATIAVEGSSNCRFENGHPVVTRSIFRDITARRRREALERALASMRDTIWKMEKGDEIEVLVKALQNCLMLLGIPFDHCGINALKLDENHFLCSNFAREGERLKIAKIDIATHPAARLMQNFMQSDKPVYRQDLQAVDIYGEWSDNTVEPAVRSVLDIPFSHGTLAISSRTPHAFSPEDIAVIQQLSNVLSEGFRRQEDLIRITASEARYRILAETLEQQVQERTATLAKLSNAVEQTVDMVMITDREGNIEYVNPAFEQATGYAQKEILGQTPHFLRSGEHSPAFYKNLWETILSGNVYNSKLVNRAKGGELYHAEKTITPIKDAQGNITHFVSTDRDVTERVQAEQRQRALELGLMQQERMASIGTAAAGIVHNLRGILHSIMMNSELLAMEHPNAAEAEQIVSSVEQMNLMIEDILAKSRQNKTPEPTDLNALLRQELSFLEADNLFKHEVEQNIHFAKTLPLINGVYTDFSQIFGNLLRNAIDAMHEQKIKQLSVSTSFDAEQIIVEVSDTGCGIEQSTIEKLFDPFFTTKFSADGGPVGTGLGLYTVQQLLEPYGAKIEVQSTVGTGTTFGVYIPR